MHFHRDVMASCDCFPEHVLRANENDVFIGSPPLAFTFGLGGLLLFPMRVGASTVLLEKPAPDALLAAIARTAPPCSSPRRRRTARWRRMARRRATRALRKCVSAGEALPAATRVLWRRPPASR